MSEPVATKRTRNSVDPLDVREHLCIGMHAVPTVEIDGKLFAKINTVDNGWLFRAYGIARMQDLPADNVLTLIKMELASTRGKPSKFTRKVDKTGAPMPEHITVTMDGQDICLANITWPVHIEATVAIFQWLTARLKEDIARTKVEPRGQDSPGPASPASTLGSSASSSTAAFPAVTDGLPEGVTWWPSRRTFRAKCSETKKVMQFRVPKGKDSSEASRLFEECREKAVFFRSTGPRWLTRLTRGPSLSELRLFWRGGIVRGSHVSYQALRAGCRWARLVVFYACQRGHEGAASHDERPCGAHLGHLWILRASDEQCSRS